MTTEFTGSCHCGAIGYVYSTDRAPREWSIRACQCGFCRAHDALSTSDPGGMLSFQTEDPAALQRYRFALRTADFLLCRNCGVYIGAVIEVDGSQYGIVNTRSLDDPPADMAGASPISYDSEDTAGRIDRRTERWTPVR